MSLLNNPNFISFSGEPVTGRVPPTLLVNGPPLTPTQRAAVMHAYKLFCDLKAVSLPGYHVSNRVLQDGSKVRMVSINGVDRVMVDPAGGDGIDKNGLPHGFAVVTNWRAPLIYKFDTGSWKADMRYHVPQVGTAGTGVKGYNQIVRTASAPAEGIVLPLVYIPGRALWDYAPHAATGSGDYAVPCNLQYAGDVGTVFNAHKTHLLTDNLVRNLKGVTLYTMAPPDALLLDPEPVTMLPGNSDSKGSAAALQVYRQALISLTGGITAFRFCNESLTRASETSYTATERNVVTIFTPINPVTNTLRDDYFASLNEDMSNSIFVTEFYAPSQVNYDNNEEFAPPSDYRNGMAGCEYRAHNLDSAATTNELAFRKEVEMVAATPATIEKIVALPAASGVEFAKLTIAMSYPRTEFWRGGIKSRGASLSSSLSGAGAWYYGTGNETRERRDADVVIDATPSATLQLGWLDVPVFEGVVQGRLSGRLHKNTTADEKNDANMFFYDFFVAGPFYITAYGPSKKAYYQGQPNMAPGWQAEMAGAPGAGTHIVTVADEALVNTGGYSFKSRYVIDYDHRSRFIAMIRVEVVCSGARWVQSESSYRGGLRVDSNPSYEVKIYFESNWNGVIGEQLLYSGACTRLAFEFSMVYAPKNIFVYPADDAAVPMSYFAPPQLQLPADAIAQLANLPLHQGVNTHLAAQDFRSDLTDIPKASDKGIELSYLRAGGRGLVEIPHKKYVQGQLYARTFTLSELYGALWLLMSLKMNAPLNNFYPEDGSASMWHYLPDLKTIIEGGTKFHVEVRNGAIGDWSGDIPATTNTSTHPPSLFPVPARVDRDIKLYQV